MKEDKQRYEKQIQDLLQNGYFVNHKGVKSTDTKKKRPRNNTYESISTKAGQSIDADFS